MKIAEYKSKLIESMKSTQGFDEMDKIVESKSIGHPSQINMGLAFRGDPTLNKQQLECLERAWPFQVRLEDGVYQFLMWDLGNSHMNFFSDLTYEAITSTLEDIQNANIHQKCMNCEHVNVVKFEDMNVDKDGPYTVCSFCETSFDVPNELYYRLKNSAKEVR